MYASVDQFFSQYVSKRSSFIACTHDFLAFCLSFFLSPSAFYFPFITVIPLSVLKILEDLRSRLGPQRSNGIANITKNLEMQEPIWWAPARWYNEIPSNKYFREGAAKIMLKIFPFFLFTPTPPPQCSFGVNQELIERHKSPGTKIFNKWRKWDDEKHPHPLIIWKSPRELTVADPGKGAPALIFRPNAEKIFLRPAPLPYLRV